MPIDWNTFKDGSQALTFLIGFAVGCAGTYMADKYTDRRRESEADAAERRRYELLRDGMRQLFREMHVDVCGHGNEHVREFVVLPNNRVMFNHDLKRFEYYEDKHLDVKNQIKRMETAGFVETVRAGSGVQTSIYRLSEGFAERLRQDTKLRR